MNLKDKLDNIADQKITWGTDIVFTLFTIVFLGGYHYEYLYKLQDSSLFLSNQVFFNETQENSAGLLLYAGRYLTQYLYYPLLGAAIMSLGHLFIVRQVRGMRQGNRPAITDYLPSLLLLLAQTTVGYAVYANFDSATVLTLELGVMLSLLLANLLTATSNKYGIKGATLLSIAIALTSYGIGIMALIAIIASGLQQQQKGDKKAATATLISGVTVFLLATCHASKYVLNEEFTRTLLAPLPDPYFTETFTYGLTALVALAGTATTVVTGKLAKANSLTHVALVLSALVATGLLTNRDANYRAEIKIQRLTENQQWDEVITEANQLEHPTAIAAMYRFTALNHSGKLWTELYDYPTRFDTIGCKYPITTELVYQSDIFFYGSAPNEGYRSAMEKWTSKNRDFKTLKFFATYALFRDEAQLAKRYLNLLKQTTFQKSWAEDREKYVGNRTLFLQEHPTMQHIDALEVKENHNSYRCDLQQVYGKHIHMNQEQWRYRIALDLFYKAMPQFENDMNGIRYAFGNQLPTYLQEAIVITALKTRNNQLVTKFPIDREVLVWSEDFFRKFTPFVKNRAAGAETLKDSQGTYSYYFASEDLFRYMKLNR